jgi:hypothetical protein
MSKVGITMFVMVWCRRLSPIFSFTMLCRNLPSYVGPLKLLISFPAEANGDLLPESTQLVSRHLNEGKNKSLKAVLDILYLTHSLVKNQNICIMQINDRERLRK